MPSSLAFKDALQRLSQNDPTLTHLELKEMDLNDQDIFNLCRLLQGNTHLTSLDVSRNAIGHLGARYLASCRSQLTALNISSNHIYSYGAAELVCNKKFKHLDVSVNFIQGDSGALQLADALDQNTTLETLNLAFNDVHLPLAEILARHKTLTSLDLGHNRSAIPLAAILSHNTTLKTLKLAGNQIEAEGAGYLAANTTLITLDLSRNNVGLEGAESLARSTTLKSLSLSFNQLTSAAAELFARNHSLTHLDLSHNHIENKSAYILAQNATLVSLYTKGNAINKRGNASIKHRLAENRVALYEDIQRLYAFSSILSNRANRLPNDIFRVICPYFLPEIPLKQALIETMIQKSDGRRHALFTHVKASPTTHDEELASHHGASKKNG